MEHARVCELHPLADGLLASIGIGLAEFVIACKTNDQACSDSKRLNTSPTTIQAEVLTKQRLPGLLSAHAIGPEHSTRSAGILLHIRTN